MYNLLVDKVKGQIKLENVTDRKNRWLGSPQNYTSEITVYNEFYYISTDRKKLKEKANEIKEAWIVETEERLEQLKNIKI